MELTKIESSPIFEVEVNPIKVEVLSEKLRSKLTKEKLEKLFALTIEAVMPRYLTRDLEIIISDDFDGAGYYNLYSKNGILKDQVVIKIEPKFVEEFIIKGFNRIFFEYKEIRKYLYDHTYEQSVDLIFNSLSESALKDVLKNMLNQSELTTLYHELIHGFLERVYRSAGNDIDIKISIDLLEEMCEKIDSVSEDEIVTTYSQVIARNHIEVVKLINSEVPAPERFETFYSFYFTGISELWVRLEEVRLIKTFKGALHEGIEDYHNLGIFVVEYLLWYYSNHTYLPPLAVFGDLVNNYNGYTITSDQITNFIKTRILPLLDEKVIYQEWVRINAQLDKEPNASNDLGVDTLAPVDI